MLMGTRMLDMNFVSSLRKQNADMRWERNFPHQK